MKCLRWSGFFDAEFVGIKAGTPAAILEHILMKKWRLKPGDRDLVVMWHRFSYEFRKEMKVVQYCLALKGTDQSHTAMALTVGLPLGIATRLLLENKIQQRGVVIPLKREFYGPILHELSLRGISFRMTDA
jgi:saccharopine dehydrogenase (NADP+, L-glutamate forming)